MEPIKTPWLQIQGSKQDKQDLRAVFDQLKITPMGWYIIGSMPKEQCVHLRFDDAIAERGSFDEYKKDIVLRRFKGNEQMAPTEYLTSLVPVLGRELMKAKTLPSYVAMIQNSINLNEVMLAKLLHETSGIIAQESIVKDWGLAYNRAVILNKDKYILSVLNGKEEWIWPHVHRMSALYQESIHVFRRLNSDDVLKRRLAVVHMQQGRYMMPQVPVLTQFGVAASTILKTMGSSLPSGVVMDIHVPLQKRSSLRQRFYSQAWGKKLHEFIVNRK